ncbi:DUF5686 family protein [Flavobacterium sp.]|uniref:DUF5686 family protein n=1 Tax=Flavobacterium sp. TaxID=239 RepID=UPI00286F92D5|nr:DUF5686 family protein [Flavobacterium sp.]
MSFSQIKGTISDEKGNSIPYAIVFEENTYNSTTANEKGVYELNVKKTDNHTLIFKSLGYKTKKEKITTTEFPYTLNAVLAEENLALNEVVINTKVNPALAIIKKAIASKKENAEKTNRFTADFYSRGIFKIKNLPKKIMGMKVDMEDKMLSYLDSTGSGIIYLSETVSKISFEKPDHFKEKIIASKIAGDNKGYSYNTALSSNYSFYNNVVKIGTNLISPIANNAFNYYKYQLEGSFFDENNHQINKIKVTPKRDKDPVFEGYIYIVDDSWAIYAIDLTIKGYRMNNEFTEFFQLKQNFDYNSINKIWAKSNQSITLVAGAFGIQFTANFNHVFSNYNFLDSFDKNTFTNEILSIETTANKKENQFWNTIRPIPLTTEEVLDYSKKDSIETVRESKKYLDSIDEKKNKFHLMNVINGYTYKNSYQKYSFHYNGLVDLSSLNFNTVQGISLSSGFSFSNWNDDLGKKTNIKTTFNYGFSDERLRVSAEYKHQFNNQNYAKLAIFGGTKVSQFNANEPIKGFINDISATFFKDNYMKLYNKEFFGVQYSQNIANGVNLEGKVDYSQRKPLFNTSNYTFLKNDKSYTSNNPQAPDDYINPGFETHHLTTFNLNATINFGNKFITRPDGKYNIKNKKYPSLFLNYEKGFAANEKKYEFDKVEAKISYNMLLKNKGELAVNFNVGKFFNAENIAFIDYKHFNGNQTHIELSEKYLDAFLLMPYYSNSTNTSYFQLHSEYNDNGFIMNKIPLLNKLKSQLVMGYHALGVPNKKPYNEFNIGLDRLGFGKFKIFRIDYVRTYENGIKTNGLVFGLKL